MKIKSDERWIVLPQGMVRNILIAAYLVSHYSYFLKCTAQLPMDNVIHKFIEGLLILESLHAHIFNAFLFVNTDRENAEWDTLKIC